MKELYGSFIKDVSYLAGGVVVDVGVSYLAEYVGCGDLYRQAVFPVACTIQSMHLMKILIDTALPRCVANK